MGATKSKEGNNAIEEYREESFKRSTEKNKRTVKAKSEGLVLIFSDHVDLMKRIVNKFNKIRELTDREKVAFNFETITFFVENTIPSALANAYKIPSLDLRHDVIDDVLTMIGCYFNELSKFFVFIDSELSLMIEREKKVQTKIQNLRKLMREYQISSNSSMKMFWNRLENAELGRQMEALCKIRSDDKRKNQDDEDSEDDEGADTSVPSTPMKK